MNAVHVGAGIESPLGLAPYPPEPPMVLNDPTLGGVSPAPVANLDLDDIPPDLINKIRNIVKADLDAHVADAERRLAQAREIEHSVLTGAGRKVSSTRSPLCSPTPTARVRDLRVRCASIGALF